jgi:hypothetical protein
MGRRLLAAPVVVLAAVLAVLLPPSVAVAAVSPTSTIGTLAGTGAARFAWDGGQAIQAGLRNPRGVVRLRRPPARRRHAQQPHPGGRRRRLNRLVRAQ